MVEYQAYSFKAMGSTISLQADLDVKKASKVFNKVEQCFREVEKIASRFDEQSELSFVNANLNMTVNVSHDLSDMLKDAYYAYQITDGSFDPRIIKSLQGLGYVDTFKDNVWTKVKVKPFVIREEWSPIIEDGRVFVGGNPVDLGGVGKSYTAWKASLILGEHCENFFVNAGGDIVFSGHAPEGTEWTVGVDNPYMRESDAPLAILGVKDACVATSSVAKHSWDADGKKYHHIINPKTGLPADAGVTAVTVVHNDVITAEIWSKSLFFETNEEIEHLAGNLKLPVLWFTDDSKMHYNEYMKPYIRWTI